jgi:hypothetical protein
VRGTVEGLLGSRHSSFRGARCDAPSLSRPVSTTCCWLRALEGRRGGERAIIVRKLASLQPHNAQTCVSSLGLHALKQHGIREKAVQGSTAMIPVAYPAGPLTPPGRRVFVRVPCCACPSITVPFPRLVCTLAKTHSLPRLHLGPASPPLSPSL